MALYRFEAKIISRSGGRSSVGAAAYRTGKTATSAAAYRHAQTLTDERTGVAYDYSRKQGIAESTILAPDLAPAWMQDRERLWNEVERVEKRQDSQLARDFVISLPHELAHGERKDLLEGFLQKHFVEKGYLCDVAYHDPHGKGDDRNHHAHVMVPMRKITEDGFAAKKERPDGNPIAAWKEELAGLREEWAHEVNLALVAAGFEQRVSHLSLEAQGLDREAEPKQGPIATQMEREGREAHAANDRRDVQERNAARAGIEQSMQNIAIMAVEQLRRGQMDEPTPKVIDDQHKRELDAIEALKAAEALITAYKARLEEEFEDARKRQGDEPKGRSDAILTGDIADAATRYSVALAAHYDIKKPFESQARVVATEHAMFVKEQAELAKEIKDERSPEQRRQLELRKTIEAHEYMAITSERLVQINTAVTGRSDHPSIIIDEARAIAYREEATRLREAYAERERAREQGRAIPAVAIEEMRLPDLDLMKHATIIYSDARKLEPVARQEAAEAAQADTRAAEPKARVADGQAAPDATVTSAKEYATAQSAAAYTATVTTNAAVVPPAPLHEPQAAKAADHAATRQADVTQEAVAPEPARQAAQPAPEHAPPRDTAKAKPPLSPEQEEMREAFMESSDQTRDAVKESTDDRRDAFKEASVADQMRDAFKESSIEDAFQQTRREPGKDRGGGRGR